MGPLVVANWQFLENQADNVVYIHYIHSNIMVLRMLLGCINMGNSLNFHSQNGIYYMKMAGKPCGLRPPRPDQSERETTSMTFPWRLAATLVLGLQLSSFLR